LLEELAALDPVLLPAVDDNPRYGAPVSDRGVYRDRTKLFRIIRAGQPATPIRTPVVLMKRPDACKAPMIPCHFGGSEKTDWKWNYASSWVVERPTSRKADALTMLPAIA